MLRQDAFKRFCPFKLSCPNPAENGNRLCHTTNCMAWEEWTDPIRDESHKITGHKLREPEQGRCEMIPPELNCNYG